MICCVFNKKLYMYNTFWRQQTVLVIMLLLHNKHMKLFWLYISFKNLLLKESVESDMPHTATVYYVVGRV